MENQNTLKVTVTEQVAVEREIEGLAKLISLTKGDSETPDVVSIVIGAKDENGKWRDDVGTKIITKQGAEAEFFNTLVFTAIVPDTPYHRALGIAGLTTTEAVSKILNQENAV